MPLYRCNQCGFVSEEARANTGSTMPCARCGTPATIFGTVFYVEKLLERYFAALREIKSLQQNDTHQTASVSETANEVATALHTLQLHDTTALATAEQHAPLLQWFVTRQIQAQFDYSLVDTSGFFDDAAHRLGERYALFSELIDRVRFAYRKNHSTVHLDLSKLAQKETQAINTLCRELYSHTFFARYHYQKPEKIVRLTLQTAPAIRQFFDGGWLEWFVFMAVITHMQQQRQSFSCARGIKLTFNNEDLHELDVVCMPKGQAPICIECKSGEFRRDIDKYLRLSKRLGLDKARFILCATDLSDEQAKSLSSMYPLTFVNLQTLGPHLQQLIS